MHDQGILRCNVKLLIIANVSIIREEYVMHGLHLNSKGKGKLTLLIAKRLSDDHMLGIKRIPVITHARSSPFFSLKAKSQRCLRYIDSRYSDFRDQDRNIDSSNSLINNK
jgi:hypothetical protein